MLETLKQYWGHDSFRGQQKQIIDSVLNNQDTIAIMATGAGKSLCYQLPSMLKEGICIVVSPLIALMQNQVQQLKEKGIKATMIQPNSSLKILDQTLESCIHGPYKFLYLSPERLQQHLVIERLKKMNINLIAIDEAHCISTWGNDFRKSYKKLHILKETFSKVPILALSATVHQKILQDIESVLMLKNTHVFKAPLNKENLHIIIRKVEDKRLKIIASLKKIKGSGILYTSSRRKAEIWTHKLQQEGLNALCYHAGLDQETRKNHQALWQNKSNQIMVATSAFGMGINKEDVSFVMHADLPSSLEDYIQQIGRAGRNGQRAFALLAYEAHEIELLYERYYDNIVNKKMFLSIYKNICNHLKVPLLEGAGKAFGFDFNAFVKQHNMDAQVLLKTLQILEQHQILKFESNGNFKASIRACVDVQQFKDLVFQQKHLQLMQQFLLRYDLEVFERAIKIDVEQIGQSIEQLSVKDIVNALQHFNRLKIIEYQSKDLHQRIVFIAPRLSSKDKKLTAIDIGQIKREKKDQLDKLVNLIETPKCKVKTLMSYFDQSITKDCGLCNTCYEKKHQPKSLNQLEKDVLSILKKGPVYKSALLKQFNISIRKNVIKILKWMIEENQLVVENERLSLNL